VISDFNCPACQSFDWIDVEQFSLHKDDHSKAPHRWRLWWKRIQRLVRTLFLARPRKQVIFCSRLNHFQRVQRKILFDVWFPSQKTVHLTSKYCKCCGLMVYEPRPTTEDVLAKYQYLNRSQHDILWKKDYSFRAQKMDRLRADRTYQTITNHSLKKYMRVLDYGGGDGRILLPFLENGHKTFLVDYSENQLPGITKLANDISEISKTEKFDIVICSHVLEHVAEPDKLLSCFHELLAEDGVIYAEVPQEILTGIRLEDNPVMHVNFFTKNSLKTLFETQRFSVVELKQKNSHYAFFYQEVIWLVAAPVKERLTSCIGKNDVMARLQPRRFTVVKRLFLLTLKPLIYKLISR